MAEAHIPHVLIFSKLTLNFVNGMNLCEPQWAAVTEGGALCEFGVLYPKRTDGSAGRHFDRQNASLF